MAEKAPVEPVEPASLGDHLRGRQFSVDANDAAIVTADQNKLHRNLHGRHMQMIAMYVLPASTRCLLSSLDEASLIAPFCAFLIKIGTMAKADLNTVVALLVQVSSLVLQVPSRPVVLPPCSSAS